MKKLKRVLITGASGFVGSYLAEHLTSVGHEVAGYDLQKPGYGGGSFYEGNICNKNELSRAINDFQPDYVFHLAGILKSESIETFYNIHILGTIALMDAIISSRMRPRVMVASSSAVYGTGKGKRPITETFRQRPLTLYAVSKLAQEITALRYFTTFALSVICVRTFNLLGPGLSDAMAPSAFAKQIAQAEKVGKPAKIYTGDLAAARDYLDVRDAVHAYALLAKYGEDGQIYNVCSGRAISMSEILQILLNQSTVSIRAVLDPARVQKQDVPVQIGSARKIQQLTKWKPKIDVKSSLVDMLNHWRKNNSGE